MFTDDAVTPVRLEILVDLLRHCRHGIAREDAYRLLQPQPLTGDHAPFIPAKATIRAALELELAEENGGSLTLSAACRKETNARVAILLAFDDQVLGKTDIEKYFALFYSYYLGLGKQVYSRKDQNNEKWAEQFNEVVFGTVEQENRFNDTKLTGLHRWFNYVGLGWYDSEEEFQAIPYDRLKRALPMIFANKKELEAEAFMAELARVCPELDGGNIFKQANRNWPPADKNCTLGLSHALIELHSDGSIELNCPADSSADNCDWSLREAEPPRNESLKGDRFTSVELLTRS